MSALEAARRLLQRGEDEAARAAFLALLRDDPTWLEALLGMAQAAAAGGYRGAAATALRQAVLHHPGSWAAQVAHGDALLQEGEFAAAAAAFRAALAADAECQAAHAGLGRALCESGDGAAEEHLRRGFAGRAVQVQPARGDGPWTPLLLLVDARGGNVPTAGWIDDRRYAVTAVYPEFFDATAALPPHAGIVNAIGDAERAGAALRRAAALAARSGRPVVNPAEAVLATERVGNAARLGGLPGVVAPAMRLVERRALAGTRLPVLVRAPGFHTGQHFQRVETEAALERAVAAMPGERVLLIEPLAARGADGLARKYRVMLIGGVAYPLHLAVSRDWKVHYFSADMAGLATARAEERRFLEDMPGALGGRAMAALAAIGAALGLDYAGVDFGLGADGSLLLFEANATMVMAAPGPEPMWDYRRPALARALAAARAMLADRIDSGGPAGA